MQLEKELSPNRNIGVEILRVLCVLYIIGFWHLFGYVYDVSVYSNVVTSTVTDIVLATFVFISGYFVALRPMESSWSGALHFYTKKLLRIYPLYFGAIVTFLLFGLTQLNSALKALVFLSMLVKPSPQTLWFITMVMLFFLITPFLLVAIQKFELRKLLAIFGVVFLVLLGYYYATKLLDIRFILYFPSFLLSVLLATGKISLPKNSYLLYILWFLSLLLSIPQVSAGSVTILLNAPLVTLSAMLLFQFFSSFSLQMPSMTKLISFISYSSFCMYLFHRPLYIMMKTVYFPNTSSGQILYLTLFCLPLVIIFSYVIQYLYDLIFSYVFKRNDRTHKMPLVSQNTDVH